MSILSSIEHCGQYLSNKESVKKKVQKILGAGMTVSKSSP